MLYAVPSRVMVPVFVLPIAVAPVTPPIFAISIAPFAVPLVIVNDARAELPPISPCIVVVPVPATKVSARVPLIVSLKVILSFVVVTLIAPVANDTGPVILTAASALIAPFKVIVPSSVLPSVTAPISVPLPIAPTDNAPVPASRVTVSTLVPAIDAIVISPPVAPVSTVRLLPLRSSIVPVAKVILSAAVVNDVSANAPISIVSPDAAVIVVVPSKL